MKKNECAVFVREIFLCGCLSLHEEQMKQGVTCLLCFVVGASRSNLLTQLGFKFVLMFTRNFRLNEIRPQYSIIFIFLPLLMVALVRKVLFLPLENKLFCLRAALSYLLCIRLLKKMIV